MPKISFLLSLATLIALLGTACVTAAVAPTPTATPTATPLPTPTRTATPVLTPSATATPALEVNIVVTIPAPNTEVIGPPLRVAGRARVFEAVLQVRLKDAQGNVLAKKTVMASYGAPEWGDFVAELSYTLPNTPQNALLAVFRLSPKDGSEVNLVVLPVRLKAK